MLRKRAAELVTIALEDSHEKESYYVPTFTSSFFHSVTYIATGLRKHKPFNSLFQHSLRFVGIANYKMSFKISLTMIFIFCS